VSAERLVVMTTSLINTNSNAMNLNRERISCMFVDELEKQMPCKNCPKLDSCFVVCEELAEWYELVEDFDGYSQCCFCCENYSALYAANFDEDMQFTHGVLSDFGLCTSIGYFLVGGEQTPCSDFKVAQTNKRPHQLLS
jgi:hypothetical protein